MVWYLIICIVCLITFSCTLLLLSLLSYKQDEKKYILTRFIDYHYKSIVSIIRAKHVLALYLSTANWRKLTGSCCKNAQPHYVIFYQIESCHSSSSCGPLSMQINGTLILLYFIEMLPHTVSNWLIRTRCQVNFGGGYIWTDKMFCVYKKKQWRGLYISENTG